MRILQISSAKRLGGGERHLIDLANGLSANGHEVFLAVRRGNSWSGRISDAQQRHFSLLNALDVVSAAKIAALVRRADIDIIHAHVARDYTIAALASHIANRPLVITRHLDRRLGSIHRLTLRRAATVIAVSNGVAAAIRAQGYVAAEKIMVVHNGVDTKRLTNPPAETEDSGLVVATVGELAEHKGHEDFIHAAARVVKTHPETKFRIIGRDNSKAQRRGPELKALAAELKLGDRLCFIDWIEEPSEIYSNLGIFVSAAHNEPFGLAIAEAMACGKAIVATNTVGACELLIDSESGKLVAIGDRDQLAAGILEFVTDAELRRHFGETARRAVDKSFTVGKMVAETERIYSRTIEERGV